MKYLLTIEMHYWNPTSGENDNMKLQHLYDSPELADKALSALEKAVHDIDSEIQIEHTLTLENWR